MTLTLYTILFFSVFVINWAGGNENHYILRERCGNLCSIVWMFVKHSNQRNICFSLVKSTYDVEEYSFGQTTLEQVFIEFAKQQEEADREEDAIHGQEQEIKV